MIPPPPPVPPPYYAVEVRRSVSAEAADDDDEESASSRTTTTDPHAALVEHVTKPDHNQMHCEYRAEATAYLLRYETMVRQQEAEDMAVLAHIRPCVSRLLQVLGLPQVSDDWKFLTQEVSFYHLKRACDILEEQGNSEWRGGTEFMTTDRQLMMVLRLLTQKVSGFDEIAATTTTITWAEFVQCYKICIAGMLTLQHLPKDSTIRARARDRTLAMLSLFEPPSTQLFHEDVVNGSTFVKAAVLKRRVHSAPLTATASRGEFSSSTRAVHPAVTNHFPVRKRRPWLKKRTKRALLAVSVLLSFLYSIKIYFSIQSTPPKVSSPAAPFSIKKRGALTTEAPFVKSPVTTTSLSEPISDSIKAFSAYPKANHKTTAPRKKQKQRHRVGAILRQWSDFVTPAGSSSDSIDGADRQTQITAPVASAVLVYLTAGAPLAAASLATVSLVALVQHVAFLLNKNQR